MTAHYAGAHMPATHVPILIRDYLELVDLDDVLAGPRGLPYAAMRLGVSTTALQKALERARKAGHLDA